MIRLTIDGAEIHTIPQLHQVFARTLAFPEWYGRNFDALYDCLNDIPVEVLIRVTNQSLLREHIGRGADILSRVLTHAAMENPKLLIEYVD